MAVIKNITLQLIKLYQKTLSPDHGLFSFFNTNYKCRFIPSCSEYTYRAIDKYGVFRGVCLGCGRILRCRPGVEGHYDPLK